MAENVKGWQPPTDEQIQQVRQQSTVGQGGGEFNQRPRFQEDSRQLNVKDVEKAELSDFIHLERLTIFMKNQDKAKGQLAFGFLTLDVGGLFTESYSTVSVLKNQNGDERVVMPYQVTPNKDDEESHNEQCSACKEWRVVGKKNYRRYTHGDISNAAATLFGRAYLSCRTCNNLKQDEENEARWNCTAAGQNWTTKGTCTKHDEKKNAADDLTIEALSGQSLDAVDTVEKNDLF